MGVVVHQLRGHMDLLAEKTPDDLEQLPLLPSPSPRTIVMRRCGVVTAAKSRLSSANPPTSIAKHSIRLDSPEMSRFSATHVVHHQTLFHVR